MFYMLLSCLILTTLSSRGTALILQVNKPKSLSIVIGQTQNTENLPSSVMDKESVISHSVGSLGWVAGASAEGQHGHLGCGSLIHHPQQVAFVLIL